MTKQLLKKHFVFIIAIMMFSAVMEQTIAQTKGNKKKPPPGCNCLIRPISAACAPTCGFLINKAPIDEALPVSSTNSNTISFHLPETQNVSAKAYDATEKLEKTIDDGKKLEEYYQTEWSAKDQTRNEMHANVYVLRKDAERILE